MSRETATERNQRLSLQQLAGLMFDQEAHDRILTEDVPSEAPEIGNIYNAPGIGLVRVWAIARDMYAPRWVIVCGSPDAPTPGQPHQPSIQVRDQETQELVTAYQEVDGRWWIGHHRESQVGVSMGWIVPLESIEATPSPEVCTNDGIPEIHHRFRSALDVRKFLLERFPDLGRFTVRSQMGVFGDVMKAKLDDVQLVFLVKLNDDRRQPVIDALKGTNAFLLK